MTISITGSVTGSAQTSFTSPTYTLSADTPPDVNSKQAVVTAFGGTQAGVDVHSVARPFTITVSRPKVFGVLGKPNPTTGLIGSVPRNTYKILTRKGVTVLDGQPNQIMIIRTEIEVPAGADIADPANVKACISLHAGGLNGFGAGLGDTALNGVL